MTDVLLFLWTMLTALETCVDAGRQMPPHTPTSCPWTGPSARKASGILVFEAVENRAAHDDSEDEAPYAWSEATRCYCSYPLKLFLPRDAGRPYCRWVYPMLFGGGLVGGDDVNFSVALSPKSCVLITSQSYTKVYMSKSGLPSRQTWDFSIANGALLCVLPDVLVCFKDASYCQTQVVRMEKGANLVLLDWYLAGRIASGERWDFTRLKTTVDVYHDSELVLREAQDMQDTPLLTVKDSMGRYNVLGVCILLGPRLSEVVAALCKELSVRENYVEHRQGILLKDVKSHTFVQDAYLLTKRTGTRPESDTIFAVSPFECISQKIDGCVIRFASTSSSQAYAKLEKILRPLYPLLGGNPFEYRY